MARLIDGDALIADCNVYNSWDAQIVKAWVDDQPTVDAIPVIRCKDCKYMSNEIDQRDGSDVFICNFNRWRRMEGKRRDDFYCADGERKDNG